MLVTEPGFKSRFVHLSPLGFYTSYTTSFMIGLTLREPTFPSRPIRTKPEPSGGECRQVFTPSGSAPIPAERKSKSGETAPVMDLCTQPPVAPFLLPDTQSSSHPLPAQPVCFWRIPRVWAKGNLKTFAILHSGTQL